MTRVLRKITFYDRDFTVSVLLYNNFLVPYIGLVLVNTIILVYTLRDEKILPHAVKNTNILIQKWLTVFDNLPEERNCYSDFYIELIHQATKLRPYLNTGRYPNGVQQEGIDFYLWLTEIPEIKEFEAGKYNFVRRYVPMMIIWMSYLILLKKILF